MKKIMEKIIAVMVMVSVLAIGGCVWMCTNAPDVVDRLNTTIDILTPLVNQLQLDITAGYDAEIQLAYIIAKGSLTAAKALLAQNCPDPTDVNNVVSAAEMISIPQGMMGVARAKKLKMNK